MIEKPVIIKHSIIFKRSSTQFVVSHASLSIEEGAKRLLSREAEISLLRKARTGDTQAFDKLAEEYRPLLFSYCYQLLKNKDTASEAVQATLVNAWNALSSLNEESYFAAWIYRIARNKSFRLLSKANEHQEISLERISELNASLNVPDPASKIVNTQALQALLEDLKKELKQIDYAILTLRVLANMNDFEIANALGMSRNAIRQRLHRMRPTLKKLQRKHQIE